MTTTTICFRVAEAERHEIAARAERDKISLSDYVRVRLGLRAEGLLNGDGALTGADEDATRAQLADHERRLAALEAQRVAGPGA